MAISITFHRFACFLEIFAVCGSMLTVSFTAQAINRPEHVGLRDIFAKQIIHVSFVIPSALHFTPNSQRYRRKMDSVLRLGTSCFQCSSDADGMLNTISYILFITVGFKLKKKKRKFIKLL